MLNPTIDDKKSGKKIKNYIFEFDGTLIDFNSAKVEATARAFKEVLGIDLSDRDLEYVASMYTDEFYNYKGLNLYTKIKVDSMKNRMLISKSADLYPGVEDMIKELADEGNFIGVVTYRHDYELDYIGRGLDKIRPYISEIVHPDKFENSKPFSQFMDCVCDKYNLNKEETVYIGSHKVDREFAENSNVKFGHAMWDSNIDMEADYHLKEPSDVTRINEVKKVKVLK